MPPMWSKAQSQADRQRKIKKMVQLVFFPQLQDGCNTNQQKAMVEGWVINVCFYFVGVFFNWFSSQKNWKFKHCKLV